MPNPCLISVSDGYSMCMLTSTAAIAARQFSLSLRDAVDPTQVDAFMDRIVATLMHYERDGRFPEHGITAVEVSATHFKTSNGQGYNRNTVEAIRLAALESLRFYEKSLAGGSNLTKPLTKINRVNQLAPNVTLTQARAGTPPTHTPTPAPYESPANNFRPPGQPLPTTSTELGFEVPVLEDTISTPIRRPEAVQTNAPTHSNNAVLGSATAHTLYPPQTSTTGFATLAAHDTGVMEPITDPAAQSATNAFPHSNPPQAFQHLTTVASPHRAPETPLHEAQVQEGLGQEARVQETRVQESRVQGAPVQEPRARVQEVRVADAKAQEPRSAASPESVPLTAINASEALRQLTAALQTKQVLASRNPEHNADSTLRIMTGSGPVEVTAVRLQSNGQIYLDTKRAN